MIVPCECGAKLKIDETKIGPSGVRVRCPRCGNILPVSKLSEGPGKKTSRGTQPGAAGPGPVVLVAHDSEVVRDTIGAVLLEAGFGVDTAADGVEALKKATENKPKGLVLDVGLPGIYGFELCERLKGNDTTRDIKIILLSSVYDMRRYKRTPVTLYGADDYIEKHHIHDFLPLKLRKLIFPEQFAASQTVPPGVGRSELPEMARPPEREFEPSLLGKGFNDARFGTQSSSLPSTAQKAGQDVQEATALLPESLSLERSIFQKEECDIPKVDAADPEAVEKARRFARIIVSDIALYNQEAVEEGLKNGTFYELLQTDVNEGREIYEKRVPKAVRDQKDYYQEAFENFIKAQGKNVR